ncbi:response regulator receiver domain [Magnetospirillum sulfuroxidans]|uniref:Response receiver domain-containing protein n=1 Tax=Magnetospirillum sulfuroxidans TaxID=611300 RepID=A0ABS5IGR6_9PROT|nr:response regulator receiver domain [Magnetospirillum sulfuroxidans]MBR9973575.1 hypothetical protein [Magnetospirillum sulfuroxidans]
MSGEHYSAFIKEAFIDPIRSVLIVDDDYPTFDEVLDAQLSSSQGGAKPSAKAWSKNPERIKKVIARFRDPKHPLLVDIHDGTNVPAGAESKIAAHLHQSDLLVLDYQLDKSKPNDGSMAFEIIRSLMRNDHFNLVAVHTSEDIDQVFRNTLIAALPPSGCVQADADAVKANELLAECEDTIEGSYDRIRASIDVDAYLFARQNPDKYMRAIGKGQAPFTAFKDACDALEWPNPDRKIVVAYLLAEVESRLMPRMNPNPAPGLVWSDGPVKYIKSDSVFVSFSAKGDEGNLLEDLLLALSTWCPRPSRLFLAKLRAEMDEYGAIAQGAALESRFALAHWYRRLLSSEGSERQWYIDDSVARHSEQLMNGILPRVAAFAKRLVETEAKLASADETTKAHFGVDFQKLDEMLRAEREHNALVSTTTPTGWHLTTGHVFEVENKIWVCVSPACDMVPGQLSSSRREAFGERLPFMAVCLTETKKGKILDAQSNRYLFLPLNGTVTSFCFNDPSDDASAPVWHTLYAEKRGVFEADGLGFTVCMTECDGDALVQKNRPARVVAQLRYEYALNFVQKLGGSMTRIGLDFVGRKEK